MANFCCRDSRFGFHEYFWEVINNSRIETKHFDNYLPLKYIKTSQISWNGQFSFSVPSFWLQAYFKGYLSVKHGKWIRPAKPRDASYLMATHGKWQLEGSRISWHQTDQTHLQSTNFFILNYKYPFVTPPCYIYYLF